MTARPVEAQAAILDDPGTYERLDPRAMRDRIAALPEQSREAWQRGLEWPLPHGWRRPARVLVAGMGGSGIGADIVATLAATREAAPVRLVRGYDPGPTGSNDLVVACSFSGETEETLHAFRATPGAGMRLAVTTGGTLAALATESGAAVFRYDDPGPPRTALGWGLFPLLAILSRLDALALDAGQVEACLDGLREDAAMLGPDVSVERNAAKRIAARLAGTVPVVLGAGMLEVAARRWAGQVSENAKQWAFALALPEADHNSIVGFGAPEWTRDRIRALLLDAPALGERDRLRVLLTQRALEEADAAAEIVTVDGERPLEAVMRAAYLGDWTSLYLAMLNGVDPTPMEPIDRLKERLQPSG